MTIRWITPFLGTAAFDAVQGISEITVIDVRDLVDKSGNSSDAILGKIRQAVDSITQRERTVVCCDYGMSRSNSIAAGIIASLEKTSFEAALRKVQEATGETDIKLGPLSAVRQALDLDITKDGCSNYQTLLVTGAQGFLGSKLLKLLGNSEFELVFPTREQIDISTGSTQLDLLASEKNVDCIVHLANPRIYTSNVALGESLTMLRNVIDVCVARDIPLIYPSSWEIYSGYAGTIHADESTPAYPRGSYGEAKHLAEVLITHHRRVSGLRCVILRSSPIYGETSDKPKFIFNFSRKAFRGETIVSHHYKNGDPKLDLLYVDDFISCIVAVLESRFIGDLNIGSGTLRSTTEIAEIIRDQLGSKSLIEKIEIDAECASVAMNYRCANLALNWEPTISIDQGIRRLMLQAFIN